MIRLIKKDISFTYKTIILAFLYTIIVALIPYISEKESVLYMSGFALFVPPIILLKKISQLEDSQEVRDFLKLLPYNSFQKVFSRFIFVFSSMFIGAFYIISLYYLNNGYVVDKYLLQFVAIEIGGLLIYTSIYMFLFYLKSYAVADNCKYALVLVLFLCIYGSNNNILTHEMLKLITSNLNIIILITYCIAIFITIMTSIFLRNKITRIKCKI